MRVTIPHEMSQSEARAKVELLLSGLASRHSGYISDLSQQWNGNELLFEFKAKGARASGHIEVTDSDVVIEGRLPLLARPFEKRIRQMIELEGKKLLCS